MKQHSFECESEEEGKNKPSGDQGVVKHGLVAIHHQLVGAGDEVKLVGGVELKGKKRIEQRGTITAYLHHLSIENAQNKTKAKNKKQENRQRGIHKELKKPFFNPTIYESISTKNDLSV